MVLEENTICYISEAGHNNFLYPSQQKVLVKERCEVQKLSLLSGGSKIAIKILKSCLMPFDITEKIAQSISPPTQDNYIIVWVDKDKCLNN